jgi:hypothetical protein
LEIVKIEAATMSNMKIMNPNKVNTPIFMPWLMGASGLP